MKFSCEKTLLQAAIATASRATAAKSPIPALEGLLIEAGYSVKLTGYDLKKGIYTTVPAEVPEPGSVVLSARLFGEIIRNLPDGTVKIETDKNNMTFITCGNAEYSIMGADSDDYPDLPSVEQHNKLCLPQSTLRDMIGETIFAVSDNESRPVYTGSLFEVENGRLTMVSVDGYRLALRREDIDSSDMDKVSFIVPGASLSDVEKLCADVDEPVTVTLGSKHISFSIGSTVLISRRLEGEFLNYRKTVPGEFKFKLKAERSALQRCVERVSLIIDDKIKNPLRCSFGMDCVSMTCVTPLGKAEDVCFISGDGGNLEIGFNNRYILDALKAAPTDSLFVCLNNGSSPCVLLPEDGGDKFLYMILPVRLKAE